MAVTVTAGRDGALGVTPTSGLSVALPGLLAARRPEVVVVGDAVLDEWLSGPSRRLSREAPVPVVDVAGTHRAPGGAAHAAVCLAALGARPALVATIGDDAEGDALRTLLTDAGVDVAGLVVEPGARTATKRRVLTDGALVARFDVTDTGPHRPTMLRSAVGAALAGRPDAVVVCDHGHGAAAAAREVLRDARDGLALLVVDAHAPGGWAPLAPDLVTPNLAEAEGLLGRPLRVRGGRDVVAVLEDAAGELRAATGAAGVVVTLDRDGSVLVPAPGDGPVHRTWAEPTAGPGTEVRACGAGDAFTAALTVARACAVPERTAVELAQAAADVVVHRDDPAPCSTADLVAALSRAHPAVLDHDEIVRVARRTRDRGGRVVFTNGCFDVLHAGHVASLNQAKRLGDVLVVALNDDASVARLKGPGRPVNPVGDRAAVVGALSCVDHVTTFGGDTAAELLAAVRPDVYAKGGDYTAETLPEAEVVASWGGRVALLDFLADRSTTAVLERAGVPRTRR